jgi:hypothetical protein
LAPFLAGASAYAGFGKPIVVTMLPTPNLSFGVAWMGPAVWLMSIGSALLDSPLEVVGVVLAVLGLGCHVITLLSFFWMPRRLQPRWYTDWVDGGRSIEQVQRWPQYGRGEGL